MIPAFRAISAGRNWIFASQPNHRAHVLVKSRKSNVMSVRHATASEILIFRNKIFMLSNCGLMYYD